MGGSFEGWLIIFFLNLTVEGSVLGFCRLKIEFLGLWRLIVIRRSQWGVTVFVVCTPVHRLSYTHNWSWTCIPRIITFVLLMRLFPLLTFIYTQHPILGHDSIHLFDYTFHFQVPKMFYLDSSSLLLISGWKFWHNSSLLVWEVPSACLNSFI